MKGLGSHEVVVFCELLATVSWKATRERERSKIIINEWYSIIHTPLAVLGLLAKTRINSLKSTVPSLFLTRELHNALPSGPSHTTPNLQNLTKIWLTRKIYKYYSYLCISSVSMVSVSRPVLQTSMQVNSWDRAAVWCSATSCTLLTNCCKIAI